MVARFTLAMTYKTHTHRVAGAAIAAVLAFGSTTLLAQDATTTSAPPAPTIVLPPVTTAPAAPPVIASPVVAPPATAVPDVPAAEPSAATSSTPRRTSTPERPAVTAADRPTGAAPIAADPAPATNAAPSIGPEPQSSNPAPDAVSASDEFAPAAPAEDGSDNTLAILGLAGLVALGGAGIYAATRRRRPLMDDDVAYDSHPVEELPGTAAASVNPPEREVSQPGAFAAVAAPVTANMEPAAPRSQIAEQIKEPAPRPAPPMPAASPSVTAFGTDANSEDRHAILENMVAEEPSDENPFTSRKARMRRARLILQGRESRGQPLGGTQRAIDWNAYSPSFNNRLVDA